MEHDDDKSEEFDLIEFAHDTQGRLDAANY